MSLSTKRVKEPPRISVEELRNIVADVKHVRDRAFIVAQLKLGLRSSEIANIKITGNGGDPPLRSDIRGLVDSRSTVGVYQHVVDRSFPVIHGERRYGNHYEGRHSLAFRERIYGTGVLANT